MLNKKDTARKKILNRNLYKCFVTAKLVSVLTLLKAKVKLNTNRFLLVVLYSSIYITVTIKITV